MLINSHSERTYSVLYNKHIYLAVSYSLNGQVQLQLGTVTEMNDPSTSSVNYYTALAAK